MANQTQIAQAILKAKNYGIELADDILASLATGCNDCHDSSKLECLIVLVGLLQDKIDTNTYDKQTDSLYASLMVLLGDYYGDVEEYNPNYYAPNVILINIGGGGAVDSVNGQIGDVVLDSDDIDEGLVNKYLTNPNLIIALMALPEFNNNTTLFAWINQKVADGQSKSQILATSPFRGNGGFKYVTEEQYNLATGVVIPPSVNAGTDQSITGTSTTLTATETQGTNPIQTRAWSILAQPVGANADIVNPSMLATLVTDMDIVGDYVFNIKVMDSAGNEANDQVTVTKTADSNVWIDANTWNDTETWTD